MCLFLATLGLHCCIRASLVVASGATFQCGVQDFHSGSFSHGVAETLGLGLSSPGAQTWLLCNMWDLPRPGIESMFPALAGEGTPLQYSCLENPMDGGAL